MWSAAGVHAPMHRLTTPSASMWPTSGRTRPTGTRSRSPASDRPSAARGPCHPGRLDRIRFAQCSCSKYNAGFFNAYARIAERDDISFVLHLGDYIYEASQTPPASQTPGADIGRDFEPLHECVTLDDYRRRYAQYHADPDAIAMHAAHPVIATIDDHELADGAWRDGADEHRPERDGPWSERRRAALRARREWTPLRLPDPADPERIFRSVAIGDLADLLLIDTRSRRDRPIRAAGGGGPGPQSARARAGRLVHPDDGIVDGPMAHRREWLSDDPALAHRASRTRSCQHSTR